MSATSAQYVCPGERHPITRSVHWGRLASFYEKCRDCPHRDDTGLLPHSVLKTWNATPHAARQSLEFTVNGVRGRYLNDFDRQRAFAWTTALAAWLWDQRPLISGRAIRGPTVVVGFDERPSSTDLAVGVVTALRQMGCRAIDIGLATKPVWRFAAKELAADAGVFVTGAGCEPSWTGLDFAAANGQPFEHVSQIAVRLDPLPSRPTRAAGSVESRAIFSAYESRLPDWFHALRPLTVVVATPLAILHDLLPRLFAGLPCRLTCQPWPRQRTTLSLPHGLERLSRLIAEQTADLGLLIDEDGDSCTVFDECGTAILQNVWQPWLQECISGDVLSDGVVTLGALSQALSLSDAPLSERLQEPRTK